MTLNWQYSGDTLTATGTNSEYVIHPDPPRGMKLQSRGYGNRPTWERWFSRYSGAQYAAEQFEQEQSDEMNAERLDRLHHTIDAKLAEVGA